MLLNSTETGLKRRILFDCFEESSQHVKTAVPSGCITSRKAESNCIENHGVIVVALPNKVDNFTDLSQHGSRIALSKKKIIA